MKKILAVFGMILATYLKISIISGNWNPILWFSVSRDPVFVISMVFSFELLEFSLACVILFWGSIDEK